MVEQLIGEIIGQMLQQQEADAALAFDLWAQSVSAQNLANEIGPRLGRLADDAFRCLLTIPNNLLPLLHSPEGWSALGAYVAGQLDRPVINYSPTVH